MTGREHDRNGQADAGPLDVPVIPLPGLVVDDRFEIISLLGSGGMSTVYKARHLLMDRIVALKILHEKLVRDEAALQRFQREAIAVSSLEHPNIVKAYGFGVFARMPYIAMEYLEGVSLAALLKQKGRFCREEALPIFSQILEALGHAHEKGIVHRDLKPSNVMLIGSQNEVKLLDFGIARILPGHGKNLQKLTLSGETVGTVLYMSPEQCKGELPDARSDLYSMGCLMYEVLDGKPPLVADTPYATLNKHLHEPCRESEYLSDCFGSVILSTLEKDPDKRPQSAGELKNALNDPAAYAATGFVPGRSEKRKRGRWLIALLLFAVLGLSLPFCSHLQILPGSKECGFGAAKPHDKQQLDKETFLEQSLDRSIKRFGPDDSRIVNPLKELAAFYTSEKHDYEKAEPHLRHLLKISEKEPGPQQLDLAESLGKLTELFKKENRHQDEEEQLLRRLLAIRERTLNPYQHDLANVVDRLAAILITQGRNSEAEPLLKRSIELWEEAQGGDSPILAKNLETLAKIYMDEHRYTEAEPLMKRALDIRRKNPDERKVHLKAILESLAGFYRKQGEPVKAEQLEAELQSINRSLSQ